MKHAKLSRRYLQQRNRLIEVSERILSTEGIDALKTRYLAEEAGIALGQIYNLVEDMDELILCVASRTLVRLEQQLEKALKQSPKSTSKHLAKNVKWFPNKKRNQAQEIEHGNGSIITNEALPLLHDAYNGRERQKVLERLPKSMTRFSDKRRDENKKLEQSPGQSIEPNEIKTALGESEEPKTTKQKRTPQENLTIIAIEYHHFARNNYHLWRAMFEDGIDKKKPLPDRVRKERLRPFRFVEQSLNELMPKATTEQVSLFAQSIFSAVHGMVSLSLNARDVGVHDEQLDGQISLLLHFLCSGLTHEQLS